MQHTWHIQTLTHEQEQLVEPLSNELHISFAAARMLVHRGLTTAEAAKTFIRPSLGQLHDPFLMRDMDKAVERLERALQKNEKILIYGDYDVDGTTAVALMWRFLYPLTKNLDYYIPDRHKEGYGISFQGVDYAQENECSLMIALDCGIKEVDKVAYANERNIDVIICDHHKPGDVLPQAVAVLNMQRADCPYPFKYLSGCGVGYKLCKAIATHLNLPQEPLKPLLQLLALSIVADRVSMTDENRILTAVGMKELRQHPFPGLQALMQVAAIIPQQLTTHDFEFKLGPRINACGRINSGRDAVQLLISDDIDYCLQLAQQVNSTNDDRKGLESQVIEEALQMLRQDPDNEHRYTTVVYSPQWHKGVLGIAASRISETYYRPTIVLSAGEGDIISGSSRSVADFDLYKAIDSCSDLLTNFGGHAFAAGLSMHARDLPLFIERFERYVSEHIRPEQRVRTLMIESELALGDITPKFYQVLKCLEPFGPDNESPLFVTRNLINNHDTRAVGKQKEHLHLDLTDRSVPISGIAFSRADMASYICSGHPVDVCYEVEENTFNHITTLQMVAKDIIPSK